MADTLEELLTPSEVSRRYKIPTSTLAYWRCRHTGPAYVRVGDGVGRIRYRVADLDAYVAANTIDPAN